MTKVVRVRDSDYKIVVGSTGSPANIILDTNPTGEFGAQGTVIVTGDLLVKGNTTVIQSETLAVTDNIIEINKGELQDGVKTLGTTAGISIDRGTQEAVSFLWDENLVSRDAVSNLAEAGTFKFVDSKDNLKPIATNSINTLGGNLALISDGTGVITVTGTSNYEENILNYSKLNTFFEIKSIKRFANVAQITLSTIHGMSTGDRVDISCFFDSTFDGVFVPITVVTDTTFTYPSVGINITEFVFRDDKGGVVRPNPIVDDDHIPNMKAVADYTISSLNNYTGKKIQEVDTRVQVFDADLSGASEIVFTVDGNQRAIITNGGLSVDNINIFGNSISNFLTDNLRIDSVLSLEHKTIEPTPIAGYTTLYAKADSEAGGTGIFFVNGNETDELINKTKALLYALIL